MSAKERILSIRLMEKVNANPAYAEALGIVVRNGRAEPTPQTASDSAVKSS
ncbi:MAG: hypothetical protein J6A88_06275 [Oscillospiraceae bacterium]|nr:hypothetical protein [Oscillospiraceae bacterium]